MTSFVNNQAETVNSTDTDYQLAQAYWTRQAAERPELMGVAGIGGCGLTEVLYRHFEEVRHLRSIVAFDRQKTVLELGSGNGRWVISLAPLVGHYTAVDFSQQMLDIARGRTERLKLGNITFCKATAQNYTPTKSVDVAYLSGITQYLHDVDLKIFLTRLSQYLRPGAVLIDRSTIHRHQRLLSEQKDYFSIYRMADELKRLFEDAGFVNHYQRPSYHVLNVPGRLGHLLRSGNCARAVAITAPLSFHLLRTLALAAELVWGPTGEMVNFSHDFFLFHRRT